ncbi:MAG: RluA family pseudouridine synthase [Candidatus Cloacimonetes bacterium]|nr:RluA family pseudouridine synthase [Candidatus Cloacimonadota bacterium]
MSQRIRIEYTASESERLDKFLVGLKIQELHSRTFIEKLVVGDRILVNLIPVKKSYLLNQGDMIDVRLPDPEPVDIVPQDIPLSVIFEDEYLAVINKEPGMIVHPGYGNADNTLVNAIVFRFGEDLSSGREPNRPGIVHRLDRGTSGLMIITKDDATQALVCDMFARRNIRKEYLAIISGIPDPPSGRIETNITRSMANPRKMCVAEEGKWSVTDYQIVHFYHFFALVRVHLLTGRMHQIRIHFAHMGFPVLGDLLYNRINYVRSLVPDNMKRKVTDLLYNQLLHQALHAYRLRFHHPVTGAEIDLVAPPPPDFIQAIDWLDSNFAIDNQKTNLNLILSDKNEWEC